MFKNKLKTSIFAGLTLYSVIAQALPTYTVKDLGTLGGNSSSPAGINSRGQIVGSSYLADNLTVHAFLYDEGRMIDLGTLGGANSRAAAINDHGQIVGTSSTNGSIISEAFLFSEGKMIGLGSLGGISSDAYDINNSGQIVGTSETLVDWRPFIYSEGVMVDLGSLGGEDGSARGINDRGQVAGYSTPAHTATGHAFLHTDGAMKDLGTFNGLGSSAYGINDAGYVIGTAWLADGGTTARAFMYHDGETTDLGTLGGSAAAAYAINSQGWIVGVSSTANNDEPHPFLYSDGKMHDLLSLIVPGSGWTVTSAYAINDHGDIAAFGHDENDRYHALLLSASRVSDIPEPGGLTLIGVAAGALTRCRRKLKRSPQ